MEATSPRTCGSLPMFVRMLLPRGSDMWEKSASMGPWRVTRAAKEKPTKAICTASRHPGQPHVHTRDFCLWPYTCMLVTPCKHCQALCCQLGKQRRSSSTPHAWTQGLVR